MKDFMLKRMVYLLGEQINDNEYDILVYSIEHIHELSQISIREMASENFVSTSAVSRLCKKLGYDGYSQYRYELASLYKEVQKQALKKKEDTSLKQNFKNSFYTLAQNLSQVPETIEEEHLMNIYNLLKSAHKIITIGLGFSDIMAQYFTYRMMMCGRDIEKVDIHAPAGIYHKVIQDADLFVVFSRSGESRGIESKIQLAKQSKIPILLFTSNPESTIVQFSDETILIKGISQSQDYSNMVTGYQVNTIAMIDALSSLLLG